MNSEIEHWKEKLIGFKANLVKDQEELKEIRHTKEIVIENIDDIGKARIIFQTTLKLAQERLSAGVNSIVTAALISIPFPEQFEFQAKFVTRRNTTECDLLFVQDGHEMYPLDACGYGAANVADFALRIAFWKLHGGLRPIIIADEPVSELDKIKQPYFMEMIKSLSNELGLQFIISSHEDSYIEGADHPFMVEKINNESQIQEIEK